MYMQSMKRKTYGKYHHNVMLTLYHNSQIESDFKPLEGLVYKDILNHIGGDKSRSRSTEICRAARRCLHTHPTDNQKRLCGITLLKDDEKDSQTDRSQVKPRDSRRSSG
jgi:hypothetical protein